MTRMAVIDIGTDHVINIIELGVQAPNPRIVENTDPPTGQLYVASPTAQIGYTYSGGVFTAPTPAAPTADVVLSQKLATGIVLTSTGTAALNGIYALDPESQDQLFKIGTFANQFAEFPSGDATVDYPDIDSVPHTFNAAHFVAFFKAVAQLVFALETQAAILGAGGTPVWPAQTKTIA